MRSLLTAVPLVALSIFSAGPVFGAPDAPASSMVPGGSLTLPLNFEENRGQAPASVRFLAHSARGTILFRSNSVLLPCAGGLQSVELPIAADAASVTGEEPSGGVANYYPGADRAGWIERVPLQQALRYHGLAPGIDLLFHGSERDPAGKPQGSGGELEYDLQVAPGADASRIVFRSSHDLQYQLQADGSALITSGKPGCGGSGLRFRAPVAYQQSGATRVAVQAAFRLTPGGHLAFNVGAYDHTRALVVDPVVQYTTLLGYNNSTVISALTLDGSGDIFITGTTTASNYPGVPTSGSAFITEFDPTGTKMLFATYIALASNVSAIAVDPRGNLYVAGVTGSGSFVTTSSNLGTCSPSFCNGGFVVKLSGNGTLVYSTLIGSGQQLPKALAVDAAGYAYVAGISADGGLQTVDAFQPNFNGGVCTSCNGGFFGKLNQTGTAWVFSSNFGTGAGYPYEPYITSLALDSQGDIYLSGPGTGVPLKNSFQQGVGGSFVSEFAPDGKTLLFSTALGGYGISNDSPGPIRVGPDGTIFIAGSQSAPDFPYTPNAALLPTTSESGLYALAINPARSGYSFATYLGSGTVSSTAIDSAGNFYFGGNFSGVSIPFVNALDSDVGSGGYIMELNSAGNVLQSTAFGGRSASQVPNAMAVDANGNIVVAGAPSGSSNAVNQFFDLINVGTGAYSEQSLLGTTSAMFDYPIFLAKISPATLPQVSLSYSGSFLTLRNAGSADLHISSIQVSGNLVNANSTCGSTIAAGTSCFLTPTDANGRSATGSITVNSDALPNSQTYTPPFATGTSPIGPYVFPDFGQLTIPPTADGSTGISRPLRIYNLGTAPASVTAITTSGSFYQTDNCGGLLQPQTYCTVQFSVTPPSSGNSAGNLYVTVQTANNQYLNGVYGSFTQNQTTGPLLLASNVSSLNFGNVLIGRSSIARPVVITNTSNTPVTITAPSITGTGSTSFAISLNTCTAPLQPQQQCLIAATFTPSSTARVAIPMSISSGVSSASVYLIGTGVAQPSITVTPSAALGNVVVGSTSTETFQVKNTGTAAVVFTNIVTSMTDQSVATDYSEQDTCSSANGLAAGASCTITVTFAPQLAGARNGVLTLLFNSQLSSQTFPLTGVGITAFSANPTSLSFGTVALGSASAPSTIQLTNQSGASQNFTLNTSSDFQIATNQCVSPLAGGAQCTFSVVFHPSVYGPEAAAITVGFGASPLALSIPVSGTGLSSISHLWIANGTGSLGALNGTGTSLYNTPLSGGGQGVAIDASGNVWSINAGGASLAEYTNLGSLVASALNGGGLANAAALAFDGAGKAWVANGSNSVSVFSNAGIALTPPTGYTGGSMAAPSGIAVDISGSVWISNQANNSVTRILGGAAPAAPLANAVTNDAPATRP